MEKTFPESNEQDLPSRKGATVFQTIRPPRFLLRRGKGDCGSSREMSPDSSGGKKLFSASQGDVLPDASRSPAGRNS